jgi:hypothetical protein
VLNLHSNGQRLVPWVYDIPKGSSGRPQTAAPTGFAIYSNDVSRDLSGPASSWSKIPRATLAAKRVIGARILSRLELKPVVAHVKEFCGVARLGQQHRPNSSYSGPIVGSRSSPVPILVSILPTDQFDSQFSRKVQIDFIGQILLSSWLKQVVGDAAC